MKDDMRDKLKRAMWKPVSDASRQDHLAAIDLELSEPSTSPALRSSRINRRTVVLAATIAVASLGGAALAAESAVPGDLLYPIKQVTEEVRSWFDDDVAASNRVDELDRLIERDAPAIEIEEGLSDARFQVDQLEPDHPLRDQLSQLERDLGQRQADTTDRATDDVAPTTERPAVVDGNDQDRTDTTEGVEDTVGDDPPATTRPASADTSDPPATSTPYQPPPTGDRGDEPPSDG